MTNSPLKQSKYALRVVENIGLLTIALATVVAMAQEIIRMVVQTHVNLGDLLLLFLYLEVLAMVLVYLESHRLPVRLPMYIAIVALARYLVLDIKEMSEWRVLVIAGATLMLAIAILVIRIGQVKFPFNERGPSVDTEARKD